MAGPGHRAGGAALTFKGVTGYDVYNCSAPFQWRGRTCIYGTVEKRDALPGECVRLFEETGEDEFTLVPGQITRQLLDPFVSRIDGELLFGGTQVIKSKGIEINCYCDFYHGQVDRPVYFTTGPDRVRRVRLVQLQNEEVGVFLHSPSRPHVVSFAAVTALKDVNEKVAAAAAPIQGLTPQDAPVSVNQAYLLASGEVGCLALRGYNQPATGSDSDSATKVESFVFNPSTCTASDRKVIATRDDFPECPSKTVGAPPSVSVSGLRARQDGQYDLYSSLNGTTMGRAVISYPFEGHGAIVGELSF